MGTSLISRKGWMGGGGVWPPLPTMKKQLYGKNVNNGFPFSIKIPVKSNTVQLGCKLSGQNHLILQIFFVQINPYKDVLFKVATGEIESLSTIKHFNKRQNK